jgi:hypothetical protein
MAIRAFWLVCLLLFIAAAPAVVHSDEGMWLFNDLPEKSLQESFGFVPSDDWARHVMLSSVRFNSGGSASFISSTGLVITNHHVAADTLHKISTAEANYFEQGFLARRRQEEVRAPDLELNQLVSIEDVTDRVNAAVSQGMSAADALKARRAVMADIEKQSLDQTGLRSDVVTLHGGAAYHLYRYKKYTDVRLVWAPEAAIAFFGGDADNFEFPRYNLDVALFRVYEQGQPARVADFLRWSTSGVAEGELVFVSGNPGKTQRIFTAAALKYLRDHHIPYMLDHLRRLEILLQQFSLEGPEPQRRARDELLGVQNSRKAYMGMLQGLQDPAFFAKKEQAEEQLIERLKDDARWRDALAALGRIDKVQREKAELLGQTASFRSRPYELAETLVLMAAEDEKPSSARLREFRDSARESLELDLYSPAPIHADLEQAKLADSLAYFVERRGGDDPLVQEVLAGKSPQERAAELIGGSSLSDVAFRKQLAAGGISAVAASSDPLIRLARLMEPEYRRLREIKDELDETELQAYASITEATRAVQGTAGYPDATFTLRLAFGVVRGYEEHGQRVPAWTTMGGAFAHEAAHHRMDPWKLPDSWHDHRDQIDSSTPFNFVCTADIVGGNSGSPVVNRSAELVGIIFDGNIHSLTSDYMYSDETSRAVSVDVRAVREALRNTYEASVLADELGH